MGSFMDAIRAIRAWQAAGASSKGYADMIRAIKGWSATAPKAPKAYAKGGKVTVGSKKATKSVSKSRKR